MKKLIVLVVCCLSFSLSTSGKEKFRIAVVPFENLGKIKSYDYLSAGFSETITIGLFQIPDILVVERQGLDRVLREQQLSMTGLINEKNDRNKKSEPSCRRCKHFWKTQCRKIHILKSGHRGKVGNYFT